MPPAAFSPESEEEFQRTVARYLNKRAATLPVLWIAQRQWGWLPTEVLELVAEKLDQPYSHILGVASFYTMFKLKPTGQFHVQVCRNLSCAMGGAETSTDRLCRKLGIERGGTSADKLFTVNTVECLAACGMAPAVQVNEDFYGQMSGDKLEQLVDVLAEKARMGAGAKA